MKKHVALVHFTILFNLFDLSGAYSQIKAPIEFENQYKISINKLTQNLLKNGAVIASPSQKDPNYYYHWTRDAALVMSTVFDLSTDQNLGMNLGQTLKQRLEAWIQFELRTQETEKLTGLGEPRYHVDGKANFDPWGRPQNDGPALRALTAMKIARQWLNQGKVKEVEQFLYRTELPANTLIKRDLEYVAHHWIEESFDLWEEEFGIHFYTSIVQWKALAEGAKLAIEMGDLDAGRFYESQAKIVMSRIQKHWDPHQKVFRYALSKSRPLLHKKQDIDIAVILGALHTFDRGFAVDSEKLRMTLNSLTLWFDRIYPINQKKSDTKGREIGFALGRYPEDHYDGVGMSEAHPWFLATSAFAEFACRLSKKDYAKPIMAQFWRIHQHSTEQGDLSEQFNRYNGYQRGARDLTWSYAAYITAYRACFSN